MGSRPSGLSGSRAAAVLGLSEFQSPLECWQRIEEERSPGFNAAHGFTLPADPDNAAIRWGTAFEDAIVSLAEEARGLKIYDREKIFTRDYLTCHVDGIWEDDAMFEGKSTSAFSYREKWGEEGTDRIPQSYQIQAQHNLMLSERDELHLGVLVFPEMPDAWEKMGWLVRHIEQTTMNAGGWWLYHDDRSCEGNPPIIDKQVRPIEWATALAEMGFFKRYTIHVNPEAQAAMLASYRHFWEHNVLGEVPPDPRDYEDVRRLFPAPKGTIVCDDTLSGWLREYKDIRDELGGKGMLSRRADELKVLILERARATDGTIDDESREKTIFRDQAGQKLGQYDGKSFRV